MNAADVLRLMRETGRPLIISGVQVTKYRDRNIGRRVSVGVSPTILDDPSAYVGEVAGRRISGSLACKLLASGKVHPRRPWWVRTRCHLATL
jgi:hypothetical protein